MQKGPVSSWIVALGIRVSCSNGGLFNFCPCC